MTGLAGFVRDCSALAGQLAALPAALTDRLAGARLADTLADQLRAVYTGPWARVQSTATRASGPNVVSIGGQHPVVSGGATASQLVPPAQWGPSGRTTSVTRRTRRGRTTYRARTGAQFSGRTDPSIDRMLANPDLVLNRVADVWGQVIDQ